LSPEPSTTKPTVKEIRETLEGARQESATRDKVDAELFGLYDQQNAVKGPEDIEIELVRCGIVTEVINQSKGLFMLQRPQVNIPPRAIGSKAEKRSTEIEQFLNLLPWKLEEEAGTPIYEPSILDVLLYGHGGWKKLYAPHHWLGYPKRQKNGDETEEPAEDYTRRTDEWKMSNPLPMIWRRIPVNANERKRTFGAAAYPIYGDDGLREFITVRTVRVRDILARRPDSDTVKELRGRMSMRKAGLGSEVELIEWMNKDWIAYVVQDNNARREEYKYIPLETFAHHLGELPVVWIEGNTPHALSIAYPMRGNAQTLDDLVSQLATGHRLYNWPTPVTKVTPSAAAATGRPPEIQVKGGKNLTLFTDEEISFLEHKGAGPDSDKLISLMLRFLDRLGPSSVILDQTAPDASGYAFNSRFHIAKTKLNAVKLMLTNAWQKDARLNMKIVEVVGEPIYLYRSVDGDEKQQAGWLEAKPKDIDGYYNAHATVEAVLPQDLPRNALVALQVTQPGPDGERLMDRGWAREVLLGQGENDRIQRRIALEDLRSNPMYKEVYQARVFAEAEEEIEAAEIAEAYSQLGVPTTALPPALQMAMQQRRQEGLGGMMVAPGGPNVAAEIAQQQIPGESVGGRAPRSTLGQAGYGRRQPTRQPTAP